MYQTKNRIHAFFILINGFPDLLQWTSHVYSSFSLLACSSKSIDPAAKSLHRRSKLVGPIPLSLGTSHCPFHLCSPPLSLNCFSDVSDGDEQSCDLKGSITTTLSLTFLSLFFWPATVNFSARLFTQSRPSRPRHQMDEMAESGGRRDATSGRPFRGLV